MSSHTVYVLFGAILALAPLRAQSFDPRMPAAVPEASGAVASAFTLRYIDIKQGTTAPAAPGQQYTVHYTGWLRDGTKFDSSVDRNEPFQFVQGRRQVIAGWEAGFEGMKVGGKRRLFIPYQLAYGELGRDTIPPKAELIFDVELLDVKPAPPSAAAADLLLPFAEMESQVMALVKAIPEEKYSWRPGPGVRSVREVLLHMANANRLDLAVADGASKDALVRQIAENAKSEKQEIPKARAIETLAASFAEVRKTLEGARASSLGREMDYFGQATTQRGVLTALDTHIAEHLGQLIAYARVNGIVPPWSR
jgi:peptidylprolyl isomerase